MTLEEAVTNLLAAQKALDDAIGVVFQLVNPPAPPAPLPLPVSEDGSAAVVSP